LIQAVSERQLATERQLGELAGALKALEARVAALSQPTALATSFRSGCRSESRDCGGDRSSSSREKGKSRPKRWW